LVPNVIVDGMNDDDDDDEEGGETKAGAAGEQFVADTEHVLPAKKASEDSSDASDHGQHNDWWQLNRKSQTPSPSDVRAALAHS